MSFLHTLTKAHIFFFIEDAADHQRTDLALHHRSEVFCCKQAPAALIQYKHRVGLTGNGLNAMEDTGNKMIFSLIAIVDVAIVMIVRHT